MLEDTRRQDCFYDPEFTENVIERKISELEKVCDLFDYNPSEYDRYVDLCKIAQLLYKKSDGVITDQTLGGLVDIIRYYVLTIKAQMDELSIYLENKHVSRYEKKEIENVSDNAVTVLGYVDKLEEKIREEIHEHNEALEELIELQDQMNEEEVKEPEHKNFTLEDCRNLHDSIKKQNAYLNEQKKMINELLDSINAM